MHVIRATQQMLETRTLVIGFQGENLRTQLRIDCASTFAEYPNATPALAIKPPAGETYPVFVERDGNEVVWDIVANNLVLKGDGELQLTFYKDNVIAKTAVGTIRVNRSLQIDGEMPDVVATWIENANRKLAEVDAQIVELEGMVDTATDAAERAEQSASTASTKAEQAAGSAATATAKATEATNAAGTATAKAAEAQLQAQYAINSAQSAAESERIATAKVGEATTAAGTATTKAEQATEAAETATEKAGDASASATAAHASEINAAESADDALSAEVGANAAKRAAEGSATHAGASAQNAGIAAQTATQKAAEATQSATNAGIFAGTATTKAEEAAESAQTAQDAQTAVEQTAEQLADSLEQIDQNTQDIAELDERKANVDGYYPDMTVGNAEQLNSSKYVENSEPYTLRPSGGTSDIGNREYLDAVVGGTLAWNQMVRDEASENSTDFADVVTVTDAVEDAAGVKVKIEPVQDLNGYDYPWPAGGGKNLFDKNAVSSGSYNPASGAFNNYGIHSDYIKVTPGQQISQNKVKATANTYGEQTFFSSWTYWDSNKQFVSGVWNGQNTVTVPDDASYLIVSTSRSIGNSSGQFTQSTVDGFLADYIIADGATIPTFAPYSNICPITGWDGVQIVVSPTTDAEDGQTYDITLPSEAGTVYGGELTVNADGSGSLVVDRIEWTAPKTNWQTYTHTSGKTIKYYNLPSETIDVIPNAITNRFYSVSDTFAYYTAALNWYSEMPECQYVYNVSGVSGSKRVWICYESDDFEDVVEGAKFIFMLQNPITYTLTASQVRTLLGTNNVWADTGDVALTYTGTDEHLTLESGKKYLARISGTDSMLLGSGQEITAAKGTDNVFNLTQMFGTAVADYVYGQGAAFFRKWFPNAVYSYNTGELKHVGGLSAHDMVGFNAWDEEWELGDYSDADGQPHAQSTRIRSKNPIPCLPNTTYYFKAPERWQTFFYDAEDHFISTGTWKANTTFTTPANCRYVRFYIVGTTTYKNDICISLTHNNSRNGEYEPYEKHSYPLDSTVVLRGIPKVGSNGVYWDGDRYLPDGTVERRYGVLVCDGTVDYSTPNIIGDYSRIQVNFTGGAGKETYPQAVSSWLDKVVHFALESDHFYCNGSGAVIIVKTSKIGATGESVKAYFSAHPLIIVYELATPTTETAQPYHSTQWVSDWGTEEFVSTGLVPVGHETRYPANLRDKLQHLPDAASGNGSYLIQQTDGQMVLTPFPAPPSSAGNYVLKATVVNGVATYTWEVAT